MDRCTCSFVSDAIGIKISCNFSCFLLRAEFVKANCTGPGHVLQRYTGLLSICILAVLHGGTVHLQCDHMNDPIWFVLFFFSFPNMRPVDTPLRSFRLDSIGRDAPDVIKGSYKPKY